MTNFSTSNRDNNLNLIRFFAAVSVLYNHSFILAGFAFEEPLWKKYTSMVTFGPLGVDIFFTTSGFLLALSILSKKDIFSFALNRALRIFPGLITAVILMIVITGLFFTQINFFDFINNNQTFQFLKNNSTLINGVAYVLPDAFINNPEQSINGSLWTLPIEIYSYCLLIFLTAISLVTKKYNSYIFTTLIAGAFFLAFFSLAKAYYTNHEHFEKYRLYFFFFYGAFIGTAIKYISLNLKCATVFLIAIIISLSHKNILFPIYTLLLPYIIFTLAYSVDGKIRKFNQVGDYSYGMYIYGFFVQQCIVAVTEKISPHTLFIYSFFITLVLSIASWHFIESPALQLKKWFNKSIDTN